MIDCPVSKKCGSCAYSRTDYATQLEDKRRAVEEAFAGAGLKVKVNPVAGMEEPRFYRNKIISYVTERAGRTVCGMYEENTHNIIPSPRCPLHDKVLDSLLHDITDYLNALKIKSFGHGGVLKNILLRIGVKTGQVMVVFVTSEDMFHGRAELVRRITSAHREVRTIVQNINPRQTSVVLGDRQRVLLGPGFIHDVLLGAKFKISPRSFYQINPCQTARLYSKALELADIRPGDNILDAYCGIGTIGICAVLKSEGCLLTGVEINRDAVRDAKVNAAENGLQRARFICGDAVRFLLDTDERVDVLFVDPPRSGCDEAFLRAIERLRPSRIVYISCNPLTQARDIASLKGRYIVREVWPFDMFPHTAHIENVLVAVPSATAQPTRPRGEVDYLRKQKKTAAMMHPKAAK